MVLARDSRLQSKDDKCYPLSRCRLYRDLREPKRRKHEALIYLRMQSVPNNNECSYDSSRVDVLRGSGAMAVTNNSSCIFAAHPQPTCLPLPTLSRETNSTVRYLEYQQHQEATRSTSDHHPPPPPSGPLLRFLDGKVHLGHVVVWMEGTEKVGMGRMEARGGHGVRTSRASQKWHASPSISIAGSIQCPPWPPTRCSD